MPSVNEEGRGPSGGGPHAAAAAPEARGIGETFVRGGASLALATAVQRVLGFVGALLAARFGGPATFGAYSIGLSTALTAASYVGFGIGTVSARFVGGVPRTSPAYRKTLGRITTAALLGGTGAAALLFVGAPAIARYVFADESFTSLLRAAAASGFALILFEGLNGVGVGLFDFRLVLTLSVTAGAGVLAALAILSPYGAGAMLVGQAVALFTAVLVTVAVHRRRLLPPVVDDVAASGPGGREILRFGLTQLGATVGVGLASWWVGVLVTHADPTLSEMGFYGVANQFRTVVTLAPTQLSALVLPLLARHAEQKADQERVIGYSTVLCSASAALIGGAVVAALPLIIRVYGERYDGAILASGLLILTAVVHMSSSPAINSLMLVDMRAFTWINASGSAALVGLGLLWVPSYGAAGAAAAWLATHLLSQLMAAVALKIRGRLAAGMMTSWLCALVGVAALLGTAVYEAGAGVSAALLLVQGTILTGLVLAFVGLALRSGLLRGGPADWLPMKSRFGTSS